MTKGYLSLPRRAVNFSSRRFPQNTGAAAYLTDAEQAQQDALIAKIKSNVEQQLSTRVTATELEAFKNSMPDFKDLPLDALRSLADPKDGVMAKLVEQGIQIQKLKTDLQPAFEDISIRSQIKKWHSSLNEEGATSGKTVLETIKDLKERKKADLKPLELEVRAANSPMLPSNTYNGSAYLPKPEIAAGIVDVIRPTYTFWNYIKKGATSSAAYVWVNKKVPAGSGGAEWIAPGTYKPATSFTIGTETSNAKKIAVNEKVAIELLDDIEGLASWVEDELLYQLYQKASLTLMGDGAGDSNTPKGIQAYANAFQFDTALLKTTNANEWDVIRAGVGYLRATNFNFPVTAFVNPIDTANMVMTKAQNQGQTFIPPATGANIVEDNNIARGSVGIYCLDLYKVLIYKGFTMMWGLENDDFTKNLRTVIAEMRIHQFVSENHAGAFLYDTFANGISQLEAP